MTESGPPEKRSRHALSRGKRSLKLTGEHGGNATAYGDAFEGSQEAAVEMKRDAEVAERSGCFHVIQTRDRI